MGRRTDLSRIESINPKLNIQQGDFPDMGPGGIEDSELTDGKHIIINCSNCEKPLVDIWITSPEAITESEVRATCCFCGDSSFVKKIQGDFHVGVTDKTDISDVKYEDYEMIEGIIVRQKILVTTAKGAN